MAFSFSQSIGWKRRLRSIARSVPLLWQLYGLYWRVRIASDLKLRPSPATVENLLDFTGEGTEPTLHGLTSQVCTAGQCAEPTYARWCDAIDSPPRLARKQWEFVFILEALSQAGMLGAGRSGIGFGCGKEPLPAVFAKHGCRVVATDLELARAAERGWVNTFQHSSGIDSLFDPRLCGRNEFYERVSFRVVDMNSIPPDLSGFDFAWSACALEHLGSLRHGMDFVRNSMRCLIPGGVAVHTTEFNLSSNEQTLEDPGCVIYRKRDIEQLAARLAADGHSVLPLNFNAGSLPVDRHIDAPPFSSSPHLKAKLARYVTTSIGLVIRKAC